MALTSQLPRIAVLAVWLTAPSLDALPLVAPAPLMSADAATAEMSKPPAGRSVKLVADQNIQLTPAAQSILDQCQQHFQRGQALLEEQNPASARDEFNAAVDAVMNLPEDMPDRAALERRAEVYIRKIQKYDVDALGAGQSADGLLFTESPLDGLLDMTFPVDPSIKNKVLESVRAASSQLPLQVTDAVLSYINFFSSPRGRRIFLYGWKRAGRYRPMIERVFREEGLPVELIHLAQAESGFAPRAVSNKSACGMWQFVRFTGGQYGLSVGNGQDDRFDPEKATRAAAKHLHDLYRQTGDWYLAMAGYNCGPLCVERAVQRTGYADFWELCRRNALPQQTQNYVPAIVAMAIIAKDPSAYDMPDVEQDPALEFDTVHLATPTHLALLADAAGTPVSELRELNPALLKDVTPPEADVHVPKGQTQTVLSALDVVPADKRTSWRLHRISAGDSLAQIARSYGVSSSALLSANAKLGPEWFDKPRVGDLVVVPVTPKLAVQKSGKGRHGGLKAHRGNSKATLSHGKRAGAKHKAPAHSTRLTGTGQPKARRAAQR